DMQEDAQSGATVAPEPMAAVEPQESSSEETSFSQKDPRKEGQRSRRSSTTARQTKEKSPRTPKKKIAAQQLHAAIDEPEQIGQQGTSLQLKQQAEDTPTAQSPESQPSLREAVQGLNQAHQAASASVADGQLRARIIPRAKAAKNQKSKTASAPG